MQVAQVGSKRDKTFIILVSLDSSILYYCIYYAGGEFFTLKDNRSWVENDFSKNFFLFEKKEGDGLLIDLLVYSFYL